MFKKYAITMCVYITVIFVPCLAKSEWYDFETFTNNVKEGFEKTSEFVKEGEYGNKIKDYGGRAVDSTKEGFEKTSEFVKEGEYGKKIKDYGGRAVDSTKEGFEKTSQYIDNIKNEYKDLSVDDIEILTDMSDKSSQYYDKMIQTGENLSEHKDLIVSYGYGAKAYSDDFIKDLAELREQARQTYDNREEIIESLNSIDIGLPSLPSIDSIQSFSPSEYIESEYSEYMSEIDKSYRKYDGVKNDDTLYGFRSGYISAVAAASVSAGAALNNLSKKGIIAGKLAKKFSKMKSVSKKAEKRDGFRKFKKVKMSSLKNREVRRKIRRSDIDYDSQLVKSFAKKHKKVNLNKIYRPSKRKKRGVKQPYSIRSSVFKKILCSNKKLSNRFASNYKKSLIKLPSYNAYDSSQIKVNISDNKPGYRNAWRTSQDCFAKLKIELPNGKIITKDSSYTASVNDYGDVDIKIKSREKLTVHNKFAKAVKTNCGKKNIKGIAAHHIIPDTLSLNPAIRKSKFTIYDVSNGICLPNTIHSGSHPDYTKALKKSLNCVPGNLSIKKTAAMVNDIKGCFEGFLNVGGIIKKKDSGQDAWYEIADSFCRNKKCPFVK
jgi:hypothetical protein